MTRRYPEVLLLPVNVTFNKGQDQMCADDIYKLLHGTVTFNEGEGQAAVQILKDLGLAASMSSFFTIFVMVLEKKS